MTPQNKLEQPANMWESCAILPTRKRGSKRVGEVATIILLDELGIIWSSDVN